MSYKAASTYIDRGKEELSDGQYQAAIGDLLKATEIAPGSDEAWFYLAESYRESGDSVHATQIYSRIVNDMPDSEYADRAKKSLTNGAATDNETGDTAQTQQEENNTDDDLAQALAAQALQQAMAGAAVPDNIENTEGAAQQ